MSETKTEETKLQLNESDMPLLEQNKETKEETKESVEAGKTEEESKETEKSSKSKRMRTATLERFSVGLDLQRRDDKAIATEIDLDFSDVLAEPDSAQSLDAVWQLSFVLFSKLRILLYRVLAALLAVPMALVWAVVFAVVTAVYVWVAAPALRLFELAVNVVARVVSGFLRCTVEPVAHAVGAVLARNNAYRVVQQRV